MIDNLILEAAAGHWSAMADFRSNRERSKRYCYGRQWDDKIYVDGSYIREEEFIRRQGNVPLKNNLIRRLVRSVLGVFRNQYSFPTAASLSLDVDNPADALLYDRLVRNADYNRLEELYARTMEEFLIGGLAVHRKSTVNFSASPSPGNRETYMLRSEYVAPDSFFVDAAARDFRGWDVKMVGQLHDLDFSALCAAFARTPEDCRRLREIFLDAASGAGFTSAPPSFSDSVATGSKDFYTPSMPGLCRVIEVWRRESRERYRVHDRLTGAVYKIEAADLSKLPQDDSVKATWMMDDVWHYEFLSPRGDVLAAGLSPLPGGGHPYVWKGYPFIDGEIHSFVSDVIDQQRHTNRLITLYDWVLRSTAKGVLLFPETALPDGVEIDDISDQWSRFNGVILFKPKAGVPLPQQVTGNASNVGITDLLNIQLSMFEDVSGVSGALEGKLAAGSVSGKLYDQQTRQAMIALLDILETYNSFIRECAMADCRMLR